MSETIIQRIINAGSNVVNTGSTFINAGYQVKNAYTKTCNFASSAKERYEQMPLWQKVGLYAGLVLAGGAVAGASTVLVSGYYIFSSLSLVEQTLTIGGLAAAALTAHEGTKSVANRFSATTFKDYPLPLKICSAVALSALGLVGALVVVKAGLISASVITPALPFISLALFIGKFIPSLIPGIGSLFEGAKNAASQMFSSNGENRNNVEASSSPSTANDTNDQNTQSAEAKEVDDMVNELNAQNEAEQMANEFLEQQNNESEVYTGQANTEVNGWMKEFEQFGGDPSEGDLMAEENGNFAPEVKDIVPQQNEVEVKEHLEDEIEDRERDLESGSNTTTTTSSEDLVKGYGKEADGETDDVVELQNIVLPEEVEELVNDFTKEVDNPLDNRLDDVLANALEEMDNAPTATTIQIPNPENKSPEQIWSEATKKYFSEALHQAYDEVSNKEVDDLGDLVSKVPTLESKEMLEEIWNNVTKKCFPETLNQTYEEITESVANNIGEIGTKVLDAATAKAFESVWEEVEKNASEQAAKMIGEFVKILASKAIDPNVIASLIG